ncbi:hypothetical protein Taro_025618 [Colocasia esculenta]|uniref:TYRAAT2-like C-terminal domain-containing protein n=1 Tax=Colocasia esculenta TaxID=4460 RepID=A0A843VL18_COLES|nr:hypothetical protein [Colocasia esculenta]
MGSTRFRRSPTPAASAFPPRRAPPASSTLCIPCIPRDHRLHHRPPAPAATTTTTIRAVDAAQPFDYEAKASTRLEQSSRLKIAVVGFGNFGQFLSHTFVRQGHAGYETLLQLVENTCKDSFDLYNGLFMYNKNSTELLDRMEVAFDSLKKELFGQLHNILRKQLFDDENLTS